MNIFFFPHEFCQSALLHKTSLFLIVFDGLNKSAVGISIGIGIGVMMLQ